MTAVAVAVTVVLAVAVAVMPAVTVAVSAARDGIAVVAAPAAVGRDILDAAGKVGSALSEVADSLEYRGHGEPVLADNED